jgi:hypothetical protein
MVTGQGEPAGLLPESEEGDATETKDGGDPLAEAAEGATKRSIAACAGRVPDLLEKR